MVLFRSVMVCRTSRMRVVVGILAGASWYFARRMRYASRRMNRATAVHSCPRIGASTPMNCALKTAAIQCAHLPHHQHQHHPSSEVQDRDLVGEDLAGVL